MFDIIKLEIQDLKFDIKKIIKNYKSIIIWLVILPFIFASIFFIYIFCFFYYCIFLIKFIFKFLLKKFYKLKKKKKYIKPIKIEKEKLNIKNIIINDVKKLIVVKAYKKAFYILYLQITLFKEVKKKKETLNIIKKIINVVLFYVFRKIVFLITTLPYIVIKNNNKITLMIKTIISINADSKKEYIYIILMNLKIRYLTEENELTKNKKIIFNKKKIKLNPPKKIYEKAYQILNDYKNTELYYDSLKIFFQEMIYFNAELKYEEQGLIKYVKGHPTGILEKKDESKNVLAINETTNEYLRYNINKLKKLDLKSKPFFKKITDKKIAYKTTVYEIKKELLKFKNNEYMNKEFEKPESKIKKLIFIQGFFLNLDKKMFVFDIKNKMICNKKYINLKEYFEKNIDEFDDKKKLAIEKMLEFYLKNKEKFQEENDNFLNLINKATIDKETKEFFIKIIEEN